MVSKKGQGLSLTTIIVAALALIVLVVLVMIFTGRIGVFNEGLSKEGQAEIIKMKIQYGQCRPTATNEVTFDQKLTAAESIETKELEKAAFLDQISRCKGFSDKSVCEGNGCMWS